MDNLHHLCIGFDNWTQVGFDSEDPKFSFGARQLEKGAGDTPGPAGKPGVDPTRCVGGRNTIQFNPSPKRKAG